MSEEMQLPEFYAAMVSGNPQARAKVCQLASRVIHDTEASRDKKCDNVKFIKQYRDKNGILKWRTYKWEIKSTHVLRPFTKQDIVEPSKILDYVRRANQKQVCTLAEAYSGKVKFKAGFYRVKPPYFDRMEGYIFLADVVLRVGMSSSQAATRIAPKRKTSKSVSTGLLEGSKPSNERHIVLTEKNFRQLLDEYGYTSYTYPKFFAIVKKGMKLPK